MSLTPALGDKHICCQWYLPEQQLTPTAFFVCFQGNLQNCALFAIVLQLAVWLECDIHVNFSALKLQTSSKAFDPRALPPRYPNLCVHYVLRKLKPRPTT